MMNKTKVNLGITQETLLIPLWARAEELKQAEPIVVAPKSAEILEAIDYDFNKFATAKGSQVSICLRDLFARINARSLSTKLSQTKSPRTRCRNWYGIEYPLRARG